MIYQKNFNSVRGSHKFGAKCVRLVAAVTLALMLPVAACAYTIVMRSGRQVEIPNDFTIAAGALNYAAAPGLNVSLALANIDIPATERANGEASGSFLRRTGAQNQTTPKVNAETSSNVNRRAARTLTNRDFEPIRRARERSEQDYERRRRELNLPSLEELRRRTEEETKRLREQSQESEGSEQQRESYWRSRASALRTEITALDAEIAYLRRNLAETDNRFFNSAIFVNPYPNFYPQVYGGGVQVYGHVGFGGGRARGGVVFGAGNIFNTYTRRVIFPPFNYPNNFVYGAPLNYATYDQSVLLARLREREAARVNLRARWNALEDEARRAGALPGWLRP